MKNKKKQPKIPKKANNSKDIALMFPKGKNSVVAYKGGWAVVIGGRVKEIYMSSESEAKNRLKSLIK